MKYKFDNGAIVLNGKLYEKAVYDVSNFTFGATFDGNGRALRYSVANGETYDFFKRNFIIIRYNGEMQNLLLDKEVSMLGRRQIVKIDLKTATLEIELFLGQKENGIFTSYRLITEREEDILELRLTNYDFKGEYTRVGNVLKDSVKVFAADTDFEFRTHNATVGFTLSAKNPQCNTFYTFGENCENVTEYVENYSKYRDILEREIADIRVPAGLNETEKALFYSAYFCALENYKEFGDYKAFMAGCNYLSPIRTYYRDSYFTVLSMYNGHTDKVRSQIIALAKGISADGNCPSAVKCDWSAWWGNHYDSPSFLAMMLYDYIKFTGDISFVQTVVDGMTVFEKAQKALEVLSGFADETGLLYKEGKYNMRDWADEVCRYGYVTYDEILYARALYSIAQLYRLLGNEELHKEYENRYNFVKKAINEILWDEDLGYYINFTNEDYTETNLSVDTVFAVIFGIADEERSKKILIKMENTLESKNNGVPEDYGCMSVYPFYSGIDATRLKSTQSFTYHNGGNWPYLTAMYAYAKRKFGMEYKYLLTGWFEYNLKKGNYTPIEYFSPYCDDGSLLQAWSGDSAFVLDEEISKSFWD